MGATSVAAVSAGCDARAAVGAERECAAAPALRFDLVRPGVRERSADGGEFCAVFATLSIEQYYAGNRGAGREHAAGHVHYCRGAGVLGEIDELPGNARFMAA